MLNENKGVIDDFNLILDATLSEFNLTRESVVCWQCLEPMDPDKAVPLRLWFSKDVGKYEGLTIREEKFYQYDIVIGFHKDCDKIRKRKNNKYIFPIIIMVIASLALLLGANFVQDWPRWVLGGFGLVIMISAIVYVLKTGTHTALLMKDASPILRKLGNNIHNSGWKVSNMPRLTGVVDKYGHQIHLNSGIYCPKDSYLTVNSGVFADGATSNLRVLLTGYYCTR